MYYTDKNGKRKNSYILSGKRQDEMCNRGWRIKLPGCDRSWNEETPQQLYDRLSKQYNDVRIYEDTTRIRGLHSIFAMCR